MAYISHNSACLCLDCGGFTDSPVCPCGSQALANVARLLDRAEAKPEPRWWQLTIEELEHLSANLVTVEQLEKMDYDN